MEKNVDSELKSGIDYVAGCRARELNRQPDNILQSLVSTSMA